MSAKLMTRTRTYTIVPRVLSDLNTTYEIRRTIESNHILGDAALVTDSGATKNLVIGDVIRVNDYFASIESSGTVFCSFAAHGTEHQTYQLLRKMTRGMGEGVLDVVAGDVLVLMRPRGGVPPHVTALEADRILRENESAMRTAMEIARLMWSPPPPMPRGVQHSAANAPPKNKDWEWENQP